MTAVLICLTALMMQIACLHGFRWHDGVISLMMIPLIALTRGRPLQEVLMLAGACGFSEDVLTGSAPGWTLATVAAVVLVHRVANVIALDSIPLIVVAIAAATLVRDLFFFCVELVAGMPPALLTHYTHMSLWNALLTAAAAIVIIPAWMRLAPVFR